MEAVPTDSMPECTRVLEIYDKMGIERGGILPFICENKPNGVLSWQNAKMLTEQNPDRFFWYTTVDLEKDTHDGKPLAEFSDGLAADGSISEATYRKVLRENAMTLFQL